MASLPVMAYFNEVSNFFNGGGEIKNGEGCMNSCLLKVRPKIS
jgi:hypothetical protein